MTKKIRVGRSENLFIFLSNFCSLEKDKKKCLLRLISSTVPETIYIMKFRTSRKLKNMILSITLAILTFLKLSVQFSETF